MSNNGRRMCSWLFNRAATLEDFADRLNHFWTFVLMFLLAAVLAWNNTYRKPMVCFLPTSVPASMHQFSEAVCWDNRVITHNVKNGDYSTPPVVSPSKLNGESSVTLYQWIPIILCFQAQLFKLPNILLLMLQGLTGISFDKIAGLTSGYKSLDLDDRQALGRQVSLYLYRWCRRYASYPPWRILTLLWLVVKLLYLANVIVQVSLLGKFLTQDVAMNNTTASNSVGDVLVRNVFEKNAANIRESITLPSSVLCDFIILQLNNIQTFRINCHIPANVIIERVLIFVWVWLVFVATVTCVSLVVWVFKTLVPTLRRRYIARAIEAGEEEVRSAVSSPADYYRFCDVVGEEGVMVLKLMSVNSSELLVTEIVSNMYSLFCGKALNKASDIKHMPSNLEMSVVE